MLPVLCAVGPFRLFGYGAAITLGGVVAGVFLWLRRAKIGLRDDDSFWALVNFFVLAGFLGGKLLYVAQYGWSGFSMMHGYSAFGGFVSVPLFVALFARWKKISALKLADYIFLCASVWHVFGRLGCFLAGCCWGTPTDRPWGLAFRDPRSMVPPDLLGVRLHPVQLYEAAGELLIAAVLYRVLLATERGRLAPGAVAAGYLAAYGVLRFSLEFVRGDALPFLGPFSQGQAMGAALLAGSAAMLLWRRRCSRSC